jgi:cation:H+ antiporter
MLTYILFVLGFVLLVKGADLLVDGSSSIAKQIGISDIVIGLTIVSLGTSAPELLVNIVASFKGNADIGIGNILGSNISNIFLILGIAALIYPLKIKHNTTWKEIPLNMMAAVVLFLMANDIFIDKANESILTRIDGFVLMIFFIIFMNYSIGLAKAHKEKYNDHKKHHIAKSIIMVIAGIVGLAYGGQWVVDGAVEVAKHNFTFCILFYKKPLPAG